MSKALLQTVGIGLIFSALLLTSCIGGGNDTMNEKISSQLFTQLDLRREQIDDPTPDRLEIMQNMGMSVDNLEIHRIFIHVTQKLSPSQIEEIETIGITLYLDSWIPPVGDHPTGYLIADMPVDSLEKLTGKDYIVRLETAEHQLQPQNGAQPQSR
ncbi:hypothetical protein ACFLUJ_09285 [Chloroflexota bacterium]